MYIFLAYTCWYLFLAEINTKNIYQVPTSYELSIVLRNLFITEILFYLFLSNLTIELSNLTKCINYFLFLILHSIYYNVVNYILIKYDVINYKTIKSKSISLYLVWYHSLLEHILLEIGSFIIPYYIFPTYVFMLQLTVITIIYLIIKNGNQ
jgi:hypothetical protein